jgi:hypothetical protein
MKLTLDVALLWAVWRLPDQFTDEGWRNRCADIGSHHFSCRVRLNAFSPAPCSYSYVTRSSLLLVAMFDASFDAGYNQLSHEVVPASTTTRFLIFSALIVLLPIPVIIGTKGRLGRANEAVDARAAASGFGDLARETFRVCLCSPYG